MTRPTTLPQLRSRDETAEIVRLHPKTLLRKAREGEIDSVRSGNKVCFTDEAIHDYLFRPKSKTSGSSRNPKYLRKK